MTTNPFYDVTALRLIDDDHRRRLSGQWGTPGRARGGRVRALLARRPAAGRGGRVSGRPRTAC